MRLIERARARSYSVLARGSDQGEAYSRHSKSDYEDEQRIKKERKRERDDGKAHEINRRCVRAERIGQLNVI